MRRCKAKISERIEDQREEREVVGYFHGWGTNYDEFEAGPGNFTVAIIELADGSVVPAYLGTVVFLDTDHKGSWKNWEDVHPEETPPKKSGLGVFCGECGERSDNRTRYCHFCGAKMA